MEGWRIFIIYLLMFLSCLDIGLTYYYVHYYKEWQPNKPYSLMERNPLLVFLWNHLGLTIGTIVGSVIILTLIYIVGKSAHWVIVLLLLLFLLFALVNHHNNIQLLHKLMNAYPSGHLPEEIFGKVVGNNTK